MALIDVNGKRFKNFMTKLYGLGAAVVIMGALFKILHLPFADFMLIIGLTTEAVIFAISAFEAPIKDYDWSLVYPEFDANESGKSGRKGTLTQEMDRMMEEAKIGPELLSSLGDGMRRLSDTAASLNSAVDAAGDGSLLGSIELRCQEHGSAQRSIRCPIGEYHKPSGGSEQFDGKVGLLDGKL